MTGLRVLDVGTYDGSLRSSANVAGPTWSRSISTPRTVAVLLPKRLLGSRVPYYQMSVYDLREDVLGGRFDVVLVLGVYYPAQQQFRDRWFKSRT